MARAAKGRRRRTLKSRGMGEGSGVLSSETRWASRVWTSAYAISGINSSAPKASDSLGTSEPSDGTSRGKRVASKDRKSVASKDRKRVARWDRKRVTS